ncbi:spore coat protein [Cytobacillus sp. FJAT-54145]|uniref:Spore coat protein n=1 Tax=Cytobacillus spartinae TaxID=3299023 RepID=A0ABW6K9F4_9BACI
MLHGHSTPNEESTKKWNALDPNHAFPYTDEDENVLEEADNVSEVGQFSREMIVIKDSLDVTVTSTETQVGASLQAALQVAIALVVNLTVADSDQAEKLTQELMQSSKLEQVNKQSVYIENSRNVNVDITDTDVAVSLQLMLQVLLALLVEIDIL